MKSIVVLIAIIFLINIKYSKQTAFTKESFDEVDQDHDNELSE